VIYYVAVERGYTLDKTACHSRAKKVWRAKARVYVGVLLLDEDDNELPIPATWRRGLP
jgi:hypothetical protein